ncbi:MAG: glycosyltransferase family 2 protein [Campylobacterota bacterium]|nr:glycosyltransferase family 2 protein [Campylobacterota bacterium]
MIKVSIVVPVFNINKKLLTKCITSLMNQTLDSIEIILVDDASSLTETIEILNDFKSKYSDIITVVTHKTNKKQGGARNSGMKVAKGQFIGFVDADDYIDKNMYKLLYEKAIDDKADIVDCDLIHVDTNDKVMKREISLSKFTELDLIQYAGRIVTKIFKLRMLQDNKIYFPENMFYEDNAIYGIYNLYANKISKINKYLYYYVRHQNSTLANSKLHIDDKVNAGIIYYDIYKKRGFLEKYQYEVQMQFVNIYFILTYRLISKYDNDYINKLNNMIEVIKNKDIDILKVIKHSKLSIKRKLEVLLLIKVPILYKWYVNLRYRKYKINVSHNE